MKERRKSVLNLNIDTKEHFGNRLLYFSSYPRIIHVTAWILRFCQNIRVNSHKLTKELSYKEIKSAEEAVIRIIQSEWPTDIQMKYIQTIQFYEENKILKVKSRLIQGEDPEDFVRPTVLPDHPIVRRLIDYIHQKLQHAGMQTTLSRLRERFRIPRGRRIVREVLQKCVSCKRYILTGLWYQTPPAPFPANRINRVATFEVTETNLAVTQPRHGMGGWWGRMIRTVKQLLKKVLGRVSVSYKKIVTFLCECQSIVNGRPLIYIYDDPNELRAIKPSGFIQDIKGNETMDLDIVGAKHLLKRIRYLKNLCYQLRQRFQKEYLSELIRSPQSFSKRRNLSLGDILLVDSDNTKTVKLAFGRILELFQGKDSVERVARLRVAKGEIIRPIQRIYSLELSSPAILNDVPVGVKDSFDTSGNDNQYTVLNEQSFETKDLPKEQLETLKRSRFGRQIVPVKRLDL
ncbi:reverse transcriptase [Caerostris extrusa]|uniref:Reverse transcriptase n=1 Tax=Caerostris extrusa TaxID=172846 RepID=A0AAV4P934_CAEEX|nr:reverse transcriptase [Caerostris extrusa]